ncbi:MAG: N(2)-acetyl-L-2,4-diaminobutanoate deacetylase DoeB2 [Acidimicrobiales bacterium]|nr:N(2)-acetyl-L-2,4-diaminobutanoate deacetylase DoeB2 [Acidimicrobiales bacterium]
MTRAWSELVDDAVTLRHALHRQPELTWSEHQTAGTLRARLDAAGISWRTCAELGTVATLAPDAPGRHVGLRADMDAMPVQEATGADYASRTPGVMHACGHDGHMATLMAATWWLHQHEADLPGPVSLLFQPAEEGGHGARAMIDDGALAGIDVIFGWHNWPAIPYGSAVCPDGTVMAGNGTFVIEVRGAGGHASQPEATRDPVLAASAITVALQQLVARRVAPQHATVVAVTSIDARSSSPTTTPDTATLEGSIRIADGTQRDDVFSRIADIASATATAHGVEVEVTPVPRYGPTVNHPGPAAEMRVVLEKRLGPDWHGGDTLVPIMASEDFSYYLDEIPGAFALVGADDDRGHDVPCHSARYDFNDRLIDPVAGVLSQLAGAPPH